MYNYVDVGVYVMREFNNISIQYKGNYIIMLIPKKKRNCVARNFTKFEKYYANSEGFVIRC